MFERETRREKILEARNKELRLKEKTKGILGLGGTATSTVSIGTGSGGAFGSLAMSQMKNKDGGDNSTKDDKGTGEGGEESQKESSSLAEMLEGGMAASQFPDDPAIMKAEKEFFQIIKQEQESRMKARKQKMDDSDQIKDKTTN